MNPAEVCEAVLALVGDRAQAEVTAGSGRRALTRFANSYIHQNVADDSWWVRLKVAADGRQAVAGTNRVDDESLERLVTRTLEAASLRPVDPD
ncbi:MAG: TldD/PmbA family protein, partial [Actinomycetota bacterium]|nr:TldD/PmbA family protein [Actinomycetota bacterium]